MDRKKKMANLTMNLLKRCAALAMLSALGSGCSLSKLTGLLKTPTPSAPPEAIGATASISGWVDPSATNVSSSQSAMLNRLLGAQARVSSGRVSAASDVCAGGIYSAAVVGGGGAIVSNGSFANGAFEIDGIPVKQELMISFFCDTGTTLRCLAKSGDSGIFCNTVADAVLLAFESALGKGVTHPYFKGVSISKVAASIVEAAQGDSTAAESFTTEIAACRAIDLSNDEKTACFSSTIQSSVFSGSFKMMQSMAEGWNVESIFTLLADVMGFSINVDSFIYSGFSTKMDAWLDTDFVAQTREFVSQVVTAQSKGQADDYVIKLECSMSYSKYHASGTIRYSPLLMEIDGFVQPSCKNSDALALNGLDGPAIQKIYEQMGANSHERIPLTKVPCEAEGSWDNTDYYCVNAPELSIVSKFKEANRNDLDGSKRDDNRRYSIGMIEVFPELMTSLNELLESGFNQQHSCATMEREGPPAVSDEGICQTWFASWVKTQKGNFSGLMGLYIYLKGTLSEPRNGAPDSLLSLNDLHKIFSKENFLNSRLTAWGQGLNGRRTKNDRWVSPILACSGDVYSVQDIFRWNYDFPAGTDEGDALLRDALESSRLPYENTFAMFEKIPTSSDIRNSIFGAAHHEEWNPLGSKYFYGATVKTTAVPIYCRMFHKGTGKAMEKELNENTRIECLDSDQLDFLGISSNKLLPNGEIDLPASFPYPYVLQERGWMGDQRGRIYALTDRKTGQLIRPGGKEILIDQVDGGNPLEEKCDSSEQAHTVVTARLRYGWGNEMREDAVQAYCMDMSAFTISNRIRFYWGGNVEITESDGNGGSWKWSVGQVGRVDTVKNATDVAPICYFAPTGNITIDAETKLASSGAGIERDPGATIEGNGRISSLGEGAAKAVVAPCSSQADGTKYYLVQMGSTSESEKKAELRAYLIEASGANAKLMYQNWGPDVQRWEDLFVSLDAKTLEGALNGRVEGSKNLVAPNTAPTYTQWGKLLNQKHDPKFDPYCDDVTGPNGVPNGRCDCYAKGTKQFKNPDECTLEDDAAETTISSAPYWTGGDKTAAYEAFFDRLGGKSGAGLRYADDAETDFNGNYFQDTQLWMNTDDIFQCAYREAGSEVYRKPTYLHWEGFWKDHTGCPNAEGVLEAGGPIRLINPKPMKNAYNVERPNQLIKLANYATKTVGQGVEIGKDDKVFSFDEALALIALRYQLPPENARIMDGGRSAKDIYPVYESVRQEEMNMDAASAILRGLTRPELLE